MWQGSSTGPFEKRKAIEVSTALKTDRQGRPEVTVLDHDDANPAFWTVLGGGAAPADVALAAAAGADAGVDAAVRCKQKQNKTK